ncbi:catalase [Phenylobacterium sp.]|uniref:catalase n=1 Tax=Phenylobacterium sp. TaxID=1871053 RepID=UPI002FE245EC
MAADKRPPHERAKSDQLEPFREDADGAALTTSQGVKVSNTDDSLTAGPRGPTLMEDFHFREKLTHFDHERIPERVVHARGSAAHGYFECYEDFSDLTQAKFLRDPSARTPVFVRFSTVVGFRGSADTVRDVRGFATKFYTEDGNFDLVGNNMPVFFIQDAIKFPDLVHSIKPQPHHEMPQASAAHDNFWDFVSLTPESLHQIMWVLSDRALPRSYRMMEGFGVHTFRLVNAEGKARFVKWHWRPKLGSHSLVWDETQKLAGKDPDFNRRDLWEAIETGDYPEYELGVQVVEEADEHGFDFDLLDPTKLIPEELVPIRPLGRMVLNRNPDNFFAETEQVAFHPGHVVPGIDFTNDPLLQGRLFSYLDTQLIRLGGPNFTEIPINRPVAQVHNNQRDGYHRQTINRGRTNYSPNTRGGGCPMTTGRMDGGYVHHQEKVEGRKVRERSPSFGDHYSQATLFWNSMSEVEKEHIVEAAHFEIGKVEELAIRERMVAHFNRIDHEFGVRVARGVGVAPPAAPAEPNHGRSSPALSLERPQRPASAATRKVAILAADGVDERDVAAMTAALEAAGAEAMLVSKFAGEITGASGKALKVDKMFIAAASVMFDAVYVPGGRDSIATLLKSGEARHFVNEAFRHCKPLAATGEGVELLRGASLSGVRLSDEGLVADAGVVTAGQVRDGRHAAADEVSRAFVEAIGGGRCWMRTGKDQVPA